MSASRTIEPFVTRLSSHTSLDALELAALRALPQQVLQVPTNYDFVRLGEHTSEAYYVVEGLVGRFGQTKVGERQIVAIDMPGDLPDLNSVAVPRAPVAMQALTVTTLMRVAHSGLREAADKFPRIASAFWRESVLDNAKLSHWLVNVGRRSAVTSMANFLCEAACRTLKSVPDGAVEFRLPINQTHLSDILGLTPVHVNRTVRQLRDAGLASFQHKLVRIPDFARLANFADFDADYLCLDGKCAPGRPASNDRGAGMPLVTAVRGESAKAASRPEAAL